MTIKGRVLRSNGDDGDWGFETVRDRIQRLKAIKIVDLNVYEATGNPIYLIPSEWDWIIQQLEKLEEVREECRTCLIMSDDAVLPKWYRNEREELQPYVRILRIIEGEKK